MNSFFKSIKKPVRTQNYRHLHFTLTMILMISNIYDIYKRIKTSIDDRHCRGETTPRFMSMTNLVEISIPNKFSVCSSSEISL